MDFTELLELLDFYHSSVLEDFQPLPLQIVSLSPQLLLLERHTQSLLPIKKILFISEFMMFFPDLSLQFTNIQCSSVQTYIKPIYGVFKISRFFFSLWALVVYLKAS